jgi:hypothetical protein
MVAPQGEADAITPPSPGCWRPPPCPWWVPWCCRWRVSALAYAVGFAFLAGVLPRGQSAGRKRGVEEEYFENLVQ